MENQFASWSIEQLYEIDISQLEVSEREDLHDELVIRIEETEKNLLNLGVDPDILDSRNKRNYLKQQAIELEILEDRILPRVISTD